MSLTNKRERTKLSKFLESGKLTVTFIIHKSHKLHITSQGNQREIMYGHVETMSCVF